MTELAQVATTTDSREAAERLARALVSERLAACVQIDGPLQSTYHWQGAVEQATEWRCTAKTTRAGAPALVERIRALHSYQQPEILVTPVLDADPAYAVWVAAETGARPPA